MKIKALKNFFAEAAKRHNIKNVNVKMNRHGIVIEADKQNKIQFMTEFHNIVRTKFLNEGFKLREIANDVNDENFTKKYEFDNANIVTDRDNEQLILPSYSDGRYTFDNVDYVDDEKLQAISNMSDEDYADYVLYGDFHNKAYDEPDFLPDDDDVICFSVSVYDPDDSDYADDEDDEYFDYSGNMFDPIYKEMNKNEKDKELKKNEKVEKFISEDEDIEDDILLGDESAEMVDDVNETEFKDFKDFCNSDTFSIDDIKKYVGNADEDEDIEILDNETKEKIMDMQISVFDWEDRGWVERDTFRIEKNVENSDDVFEDFLKFAKAKGNSVVEYGVIDLFVDENDIDRDSKDLADEWINEGLISMESFKFVDEDDETEDEEEIEECNDKRNFKEERNIVREFKKLKAIRESRKKRADEKKNLKENKYNRKNFRNR